MDATAAEKNAATTTATAKATAFTTSNSVSAIDIDVSGTVARQSCDSDGRIPEVVGVVLPRIKIEFCTQCRWMLRAAYSYIPSSQPPQNRKTAEDGEVAAKHVVLWDRKTEGGFPETKVLKQRVRDHLDPGRDLGHSDTGRKKHPKESASVGTGGAGIKTGVDTSGTASTGVRGETARIGTSVSCVDDSTRTSLVASGEALKQKEDIKVCEDCDK